MTYQDICNCICQNTQKWRYTSEYVKPTAQLVFKNRFPKGGLTCRRQVVNPWHQTSQGQSVAKPETSHVEYPSWVGRWDIKRSDGTMLNPIFWKKVQGQKHPGRWGIVEHQIPSIKVLFKINAKSHKYPGIKLLSSESKTQLVNRRKQNSYGRAYIYIYILTQIFWTGTKVIRRKHIIQPTAKFKGTKCNGRIHRYGASIFGDIIINVT